jgi:hypothetical protein
MLHVARKPAVRLMRMSAPASKLAVGGAWFFIVYSLACLTWAVVMHGMGPVQSVTSLYMTTVGIETYRAWGLAYAGVPGLVLVSAETAALLAAATMSVMKRTRWRRLGHAALIAWAGLWLGNLVWLYGLDGELNTFVQASVMAVLFGCTLWRAARGWPRRPSAKRVNEDLHQEEAVATDADSDADPDVSCSRAMGTSTCCDRCPAVATRMLRLARDGARRAISYLQTHGVLRQNRRSQAV